METLSLKLISEVTDTNTARDILIDYLNAGKEEGSFYLNSVKSIIEVNNYILLEVMVLLEKDITIFRGYDKQVSVFAKSFRLHKQKG